jgi:hypothetical protein
MQQATKPKKITPLPAGPDVILKIWLPAPLRDEVTIRAIRLGIERNEYIKRLILTDLERVK